jgi:hypothetical protein
LFGALGRVRSQSRSHPIRLAGALAALVLGAGALTGCDPATSSPPTPLVPPASAASAAPVAATAPSSSSASPAPPTTTTTAAAAPVPVNTAPVAAPDPGASCGGDYYINSDGNCVHRPEQAPAAPAGATARCNDGTYSFSQHRSGTCSHHGGVAEWL